MAMGAQVILRSSRSGERKVPLDKFYKGVRRTVMQPDEMLVDIKFPAMQKNQRGTFIKFALRRAQAISMVNVAVLLTLRCKRICRNSVDHFWCGCADHHSCSVAEDLSVGKQLTDRCHSAGGPSRRLMKHIQSAMCAARPDIAKRWRGCQSASAVWVNWYPAQCDELPESRSCCRGWNHICPTKRNFSSSFAGNDLGRS